VAAQALAAAFADTDEDWWPESLHAYFVREGRSAGPIGYEVDGDDDPDARVRFRRVTATQGYETVLILETAFGVLEPGPALPDRPEAFGDDVAGWVPDGPDDQAWLEERNNRMPLDLRFDTEPSILTARKGGTSLEQRFWFRASQPLPDRVRHHACALTYASDLLLVSTALATHGLGHRDGVQAASMDHAVWFHLPVRADTWVTYEQTSLTSAGGRGLSGGRMLDRSGELVATVRQEVLLRLDG
jgi:acyl-CoA thioesterase-2